MAEASSAHPAVERLLQNHAAFEASVARREPYSCTAGPPRQPCTPAWLRIWPRGCTPTCSPVACWSSWRWTSGTFSLRPDLTHRVRDRVVRSARPARVQWTLSVGGHTRMVWRWMKLDAGRTHSVAVTRQGGGPVPPRPGRGGPGQRGHRPCSARNRALSRPGRVRCTNSRPVPTLHLERRPEDATAVALADRTGPLPILYINHADHLFWLGVGVSTSS